jgi:hypothetical protein
MRMPMKMAGFARTESEMARTHVNMMLENPTNTIP